MSKPSDSQIKKDLVTTVIELTLLEIGKPILEKVTNELFIQFNCTIADCYEKPEYLNKVLKDLFGNIYSKITDSMKKRLEVFSSEKPIKHFLEIMTG